MTKEKAKTVPDSFNEIANKCNCQKNLSSGMIIVGSFLHNNLITSDDKDILMYWTQKEVELVVGERFKRNLKSEIFEKDDS